MTGRDAVRYERLGGGEVRRTAGEILSTVRPRERAPSRRPCVLVNMIASVDGRAALDGNTRGLGGPADLEMLLELRVISDAVLIGSGTLRAEGYGRLMRSPERRARRVAAGGAQDPPAVLVSRELDLPWDAALFAAAEQPVLVYTHSRRRPLATKAPVEVVRAPHPVTLAWVLSDLRARGVRALLCEGGPTLNRQLLATGAVDDLFLTLAPWLTADDAEPTIVAGPALAPPAPARLAWVLRHDDELFLRYRLRG